MAVFEGKAKKYRLAISGATGLIGSSLTAFLHTGGHEVIKLVRQTPSAQEPEIFWNPYNGEVDNEKLEGLDAVVHLCGENIAGQRWTPEFKTRLWKSRIDVTRFLCESLAGLENPPKVLIAASATGYYGNRPEEAVDEDSPAGEGFLPELCQAWEHATLPAVERGIRVVNLRIAPVVTVHGGMLKKMLPAFRLGLGGPVGSGEQWLSWVGLDELIAMIYFLLGEDSTSGPVNACSPHALRNRDFAKALGHVLHRPAFLPLPAFAVKALFGEMGKSLLLEGCRARPSRLQEAGYDFIQPHLPEILKEELGKK
ncbi:MAG: TIGR01777 family oxidoreductase [Candidatus Sumerlaeia bacterium]